MKKSFDRKFLAENFGEAKLCRNIKLKNFCGIGSRLSCLNLGYLDFKIKFEMGQKTTGLYKSVSRRYLKLFKISLAVK